MNNKDWESLSKKSKMKLGAYGEYFAKMEFSANGFDVFTSEVDDHGIDFVVKGLKGYCAIQVKSVQSTTGYVFMKKSHFDINDDSLYLCLLIFTQGEYPDLYLIPAHDWKNETDLLRNRNYDKPGQKSNPEYGINISQKNTLLLERYKFDEMINTL